MKWGMVASGALGLVACFLPIWTGNGVSTTFWDGHVLEMAPTLVLMIGYGVGVVAGLIDAIVKPPMKRWPTQLAMLAFAFVLIRLVGSYWGVLFDLAFGGKLMLAAALLGFAFAAVKAFKAERA